MRLMDGRASARAARRRKRGPAPGPKPGRRPAGAEEHGPVRASGPGTTAVRLASMRAWVQRLPGAERASTRPIPERRVRYARFGGLTGVSRPSGLAGGRSDFQPPGPGYRPQQRAASPPGLP